MKFMIVILDYVKCELLQIVQLLCSVTMNDERRSMLNSLKGDEGPYPRICA